MVCEAANEAVADLTSEDLESLQELQLTMEMDCWPPKNSMLHTGHGGLYDARAEGLISPAALKMT